MIAPVLNYLRNNKLFMNSLYFLRLRTPVIPHVIGVKSYRQRSAWKLQLERCSCDRDFIDYIVAKRITQKTIFHMGTGEHHYVGFNNHANNLKNNVLGLTPTKPEFNRYMDEVIKDPSLALSYKVLFSDLYMLNENFLPSFDIVNLFHLCEFYNESEYVPLLNDQGVLNLFLKKLSTGGLFVFYTHSVAWPKTKILVQSMVDKSQITKVEDFKNLVIYQKNRGPVE